MTPVSEPAAATTTRLHIDYPYGVDARGRTATTDDADHVRDLIEQVLFTSPGERVNRPDFGTGLLQLVFAAGSDVLATGLQQMVAAALQRWLADVIEVGGVDVSAEGPVLRVTVQYTVRADGERRSANLSRTV